MIGQRNFLVIEDSDADYRLIIRQLDRGGLGDVHCRRVQSTAELETALTDQTWDVVLSDYRVPAMSFEDSLDLIVARLPGVPVVLISGTVGEEKAVELQRRGLWDFVLKGNLVRLPSAVERSLREADDRRLRKATEARLELAARVFTHAKEGIVITDADGIIIDVNDSFTRITGYTREEAIGQNPRFLKSDRQSDEFYRSLWQALLSTDHWSGELWNRRKNGEIYAEMLTISVVRDQQGKTQNYVGLSNDITELKEHQRQLEHVANHDVLTDLPNRLLLADRMHQSIAYSRRRGNNLAVVYLDLDGFKEINDRYGHAIGNRLLIVLAQRMRPALRDDDTLARVGGDEFVAVLNDLERSQDCAPVLNRLLQAVAAPVIVDGYHIEVSASIGAALYPQDGEEADLLLRHADQAMYLAKQAGKNRYQLFDAKNDLAVKSQRRTLGEIRRALDGGEFVLHYQPKVNMRTGQVFGAEALIRWQHPINGLLPPAAFLPMIEDDPISVDLGYWVIETALDQMLLWRKEGLDVSVSVNVGARQMVDGDFVRRLGQCLNARPEVCRSKLEIEIVETSDLSDVGSIATVMRACCDLGVGFALDDFGTGYSSLTHLRHLPAELIKIDQAFVRRMLDDHEDFAIVNGVIALARAFQRKVIAEGVETVAHGEALVRLGCDLGQGYGIAKPMPGAALPAWVLTWRPDPSWARAETDSEAGLTAGSSP